MSNQKLRRSFIERVIWDLRSQIRHPPKIFADFGLTPGSSKNLFQIPRLDFELGSSSAALHDVIQHQVQIKKPCFSLKDRKKLPFNIYQQERLPNFALLQFLEQNLYNADFM